MLLKLIRYFAIGSLIIFLMYVIMFLVASNSRGNELKSLIEAPSYPHLITDDDCNKLLHNENLIHFVDTPNIGSCFYFAYKDHHTIQKSYVSQSKKYLFWFGSKKNYFRIVMN